MSSNEKKPIDHISTLAKEEKLELEMMKMLFSKNKQKKTFKDGLHIISDPETGSITLKEHYKNGKRDGLFELFYVNGQICMTGEYFQGKREGLHESFYENGELWDTGKFIKDKPVGLHKIFHENGKIHQTVFYKDGKIDGKVHSYLDTGELEWSKEFLNGEEV